MSSSPAIPVELEDNQEVMFNMAKEAVELYFKHMEQYVTCLDSVCVDTYSQNKYYYVNKGDFKPYISVKSDHFLCHITCKDKPEINLIRVHGSFRVFTSDSSEVFLKSDEARDRAVTYMVHCLV